MAEIRNKLKFDFIFPVIFWLYARIVFHCVHLEHIPRLGDWRSYMSVSSQICSPDGVMPTLPPCNWVLGVTFPAVPASTATAPQLNPEGSILKLRKRWQNPPDCRWPRHPTLCIRSRQVIVVSDVEC